MNNLGDLSTEENDIVIYSNEKNMNNNVDTKIDQNQSDLNENQLMLDLMGLSDDDVEDCIEKITTEDCPDEMSELNNGTKKLPEIPQVKKRVDFKVNKLPKLKPIEKPRNPNIKKATSAKCLPEISQRRSPRINQLPKLKNIQRV